MLPSRRVHDGGDAGERDYPADHVEAVGSRSVYPPAPGQGHHDEDAAVRCINAAEMGIGGLQRRQDTVEEEGKAADHADPDGAVVAEPEPNEVAAADLAKAGEREQGDGAEDCDVDDAMVAGRGSEREQAAADR